MCFSGRPVDGGDDVDNVDDVDDIDNVDDGDDKVKIMSNVCIKAHLCSVCFSGRPHNVDDGDDIMVDYVDNVVDRDNVDGRDGTI